MQLEAADLRIERLFLNGIFYQKQTFDYDYDYDRLLDYIRLDRNNWVTYYEKIYDVISFCTCTFDKNIFDFVEAASDFAMLNTINKTFSSNKYYDRFDRFYNYIYYFGFAMVEFRIGYLNYFHSLKKKDKSKQEKSIKYVLNQHFKKQHLNMCRLLKNKYQISNNAKTILEKNFENIRDEIDKFYLNFKPQNNQKVYKFRSEISAVYHYRKHGVMKQIEKKNAVMDIKTYIQEAHRIIHDPKSVKTQVKGISVFKSVKEKVILSNCNRYITSYIR
jgi:hypothetical protein